MLRGIRYGNLPKILSIQYNQTSCVLLAIVTHHKQHAIILAFGVWCGYKNWLTRNQMLFFPYGLLPFLKIVLYNGIRKASAAVA